jgi:hypothetical protein
MDNINSLINSFNSCSISQNTAYLDKIIYDCIEFDTEFIIGCYNNNCPSLFDSIDTQMRLAKILIEDDTVEFRFLQLFPNENSLFKIIQDLAFQRMPTAQFIEIFPYFDEYVNDVYTTIKA